MSNKLIDKLLNDRREFGDVWVTDEDAKSIAAALKAGQAMRSALYLHEMKMATKAWDKATKEGEG